MAASAPQEADTAPETAAAPRTRWDSLAFWGLHAWILGYVGVLAGAFYMQFGKGEFPCPLCMLQRYGMVLSTLGALYIVMQARRGELTTRRYAQGLGMGIIGALTGALVSVRQILLHIMPGDPGYGEPVLGLHLYTWALITFFVVLLFAGVLLMAAPAAVPVAPAQGSGLWKLSTVVVWLFLIILAANVVAIILLEGFAWVLPDDPTGYNLLDQLGLSG